MNESEANPNPNMEKKCPQCGASLPTGALEGLCPACLLRQGATAETGTQPEATPFQPPGLEEMARLFPQLEIIALIGKGGMGAVYKARQPALDRLVALKILPPQVASGPGFAERFNREARALAKLVHPNIVAVHEFGQVNGLPFFIMEFVDGLNLRQLERAGKLSPREALQIVPQICEALQFAHDEGIVHRDIKPENILLDKKGRVKIADFGIAKIMGKGDEELGITETGGSVGTPQYMAPEQVEKPETVDHRADIFSLGVVFYEMLTGELPLGKFSAPSSKVQVDVRLDDVVLRALEKEPARRYQRASQVKTAVDTIAGSAASPGRADAEALAREILSRDYQLDIGSCLRRGWELVKSDFWPAIGVTAVILVLAHAASIAYLVVGGPLMGGLSLYYLKKIRGEPANMETAFSGFRIAFVPLFLANLVSWVLIAIGLVCLVLPGIYLVVAWMFALILIIDRGLEFWPAMELSRRIVTRHWWKLFGFWLVLVLMNLAGVLACGLGIFFLAPIGVAAAVYAYEDIFGWARGIANQPGARVGPSGTVVVPGAGASPARFGTRGWKPVGIGLAAMLLLAWLVVALSFLNVRARHRNIVFLEPAPNIEPGEKFVLGSVIERMIDFTNFNRRALILASGNYVTSTTNQPLDFGVNGADTLRVAGVDLYLNDTAVDDLKARSKTEESSLPVLNALDWNKLSALPAEDGDGQFQGSITEVDLAMLERLSTQTAKEADEAPNAEAMIRGTNVFLFVTREGTHGVLQMAALAEGGRGVKIRYKLVKEAGSNGTASVSRQTLRERLDAAAGIGRSEERCAALAGIATAAAQAGEVEIAKMALQQISDAGMHDQTALESARSLARRNLRKHGIAIAKTIYGTEIRDQALSELAR